MSQQAFLATILVLASAGASAKSLIPTNAPNCSLVSPPADAGEVMGEESKWDLRVFPRYRDFPKQYTGCQISWVSANDRWQQFAVAYFERGKPVLFFGPVAMTGRKDDLVCRYHGRKLISGPADDCPDSSGLVVKSMPPGCVQRTRSGNVRPSDCEDD